MTPRPAILAFLAAATFALCSCKRELRPTPAAVADHYHALVDTLDDARPGACAAALTKFLEEAGRYQIADSARAQIRHFELMAHGGYHEARELAREGEFDRAEEMLQDLSWLDTEDGRSAHEHLRFEFYMEKARWLLVRQRFDEADAVARELLGHDLNRFQRNEAEKVLDYTGNVGAAMQMAKGTEERSACKQLTVFLATMYVDNGTYPETFSLEDLQQMDPYNAQAMGRMFSSFDEYQASRDHYSLVAVAKSGHRYHIVDGEVKD
jgi:hypothetical protein